MATIVANWRNAGNVPVETWHTAITAYGGPAGLASEAAYQAATPHTALCLAQLFMESKYGTAWDANDPDSHNALNMKNPVGGGYVQFSSWVEGIAAWKARILDPAYKDGVYAATTTLEQYIHAFAPDGDGKNNEAGYVAALRRLWAVWGINVTTPASPAEPTGETPVATRNPIVIIQDLLVEAYVPKASDEQGFDFGTRFIMGLIEHETQGEGSGSWYRKFFSCLTSDSCKKYGICEDGERCDDALVDYLIPADGKIWRFQDPFTTNRIPYGSGGKVPNRTTAIGRAINDYIAKRDVFGGVNALYACVEIVKKRGAAMTAAQIEGTARLLAYICAMKGYPAGDWKYPDVLGGTVPTSANHSDVVTTTNCRINDDDRAKFEARCTVILTAYYAGTLDGGITTGGSGSTDTNTDTGTTPAVADVIPGLDLAVAARLFGAAKGEDGATYKFDAKGPVSQLWLASGKDTGNWPSLVAVLNYETGARRYFRFEGGATIIAVTGQPPRWLKEGAV